MILGTPTESRGQASGVSSQCDKCRTSPTQDLVAPVAVLAVTQRTTNHQVTIELRWSGTQHRCLQTPPETTCAPGSFPCLGHVSLSPASNCRQLLTPRFPRYVPSIPDTRSLSSVSREKVSRFLPGYRVGASEPGVFSLLQILEESNALFQHLVQHLREDVPDLPLRVG